MWKFICVFALIISNLEPAHAQVTALTFDCEYVSKAKPESFYEACADGYMGVSSLKWSKWSNKEAIAIGKYFANDCVPDCADGKIHYWQAKITLSDPIKIKGKIYLTKLNWYQINNLGAQLKQGKSGGWNLYQSFKSMGGKIN